MTGPDIGLITGRSYDFFGDLFEKAAKTCPVPGKSAWTGSKIGLRTNRSLDFHGDLFEKAAKSELVPWREVEKMKFWIIKMERRGENS